MIYVFTYIKPAESLKRRLELLRLIGRQILYTYIHVYILKYKIIQLTMSNEKMVAQSRSRELENSAVPQTVRRDALWVQIPPPAGNSQKAIINLGRINI